MAKVTTGATMSLDGFIAGPEDSGFDHLFRWYANGDVETPTAMPGMTLRTSAASAGHLRELNERTGAPLVGRHLYDMTGAWGGRHPMDVPVVVLTHRRPDDRPEDDDSFAFVTTGIEDAVARARELAGGKWVVVNGGTIARQCLEAGLVDEVHLALVPVILGRGVPFFGPVGNAPIELDGPTTLVQGKEVTHLHYRVRRG